MNQWHIDKQVCCLFAEIICIVILRTNLQYSLLYLKILSEKKAFYIKLNTILNAKFLLIMDKLENFYKALEKNSDDDDVRE